MESAKSILRSLVPSTQNVRKAISKYSTETGVREVQQQSLIQLEEEFETITDASRAMIEALSKPRLPGRRFKLDAHSMAWLSSTKPEACLDTLRKMGDLLGSEHEVSSVNAAIELYLDQKAHFDFLLTTDMCNPEDEMLGQMASSRTEDVCMQGQEQPPFTIARDIARKEVLLRKRDKLIRLLDMLDCTGKHRQTSLGRQSDTCTWLHSTAEYMSWKEGQDSLLWLQGKAGAGKTILASSVIDDLTNAKHDGEHLAYFYCDFRTRRSTTAVEVLRSILAQLIAQLSIIDPDSEQLLDEMLKEYQSSHPDPFYNPKGLARRLSKVARLFPRKPFVVVDGLDECKEAESLLDGLIISAGDVRVFATSRPLWSIASILSTFTCISMDRMASELSADIRLYVTRELDSRDQLKLCDDSLKEEIRTKLCARADGMFRWVQCQIDMLEKCTPGPEIQRALKSLPEGLEETYRRILLAIDRSPSDAHLVQRVLVWLVASLRPIRMTELLEGVTIDPDYRMLDSSYRLMKGTDFLLEVCQSLVVHDDDTDIIALSHMSVKEYLMGELVLDKLPSHHIVLEDAHNSLARRCMAYIGFCLEKSGDRSSILRRDQEPDASKLHESRPLLKYVLSDGFGHLGHLEPQNAGIFKDIEALRMVICRYAHEWNQLCRLVPSIRTGIPWPTSEHDFTLYTLIAFGSEALLETFVRHTSLAPQEGTNPLIYAAHFGKANHARTLISQGADVNQPGITIADSDSSEMEMPMAISLEVAVHCCHTKMIDIFLEEGSTIPETLLAHVLRDRPQDFPPSVVRRLLQTREFLAWENAPWENKRLLESVVDCAEEFEGVVDHDLKLTLTRLVEVGCAEVLLLVAVEIGCVSVIKALLSVNDSSVLDESSTSHVNAVVNAVARNGDTLLHVAMKVSSEDLCLEITQLLVGAGCNPRDRNADDKPPIHIAVMQGYTSVVEYLLSLAVELPARILFTALQASFLNQTKMVRFLLSKGANARVLNSDGNTLLHVAMRVSDGDIGLVIADILLNAGCDSPAWNCDELLHLATKEGYRQMCKYLSIFYTCSEIVSLLDPNPSQQVTAFNALMGNKDGKRSMTQEEDSLLQIIRQIHNDELVILPLVIKWASSPGSLLSCGAEMFHSAVGQGFHRVVEYLLSLGCPFPQNILFTTLKYQVSMFMFLAGKGADLQAKDIDGNTLLHASMQNLEEAQCLTITQFLVGANCTSSALNWKGRSPIDIAVSRGFVTVVQYLLFKHTPLPPRILLSALPHATVMIPFLLHNGAHHNPGVESIYGNTLLYDTITTLDDEVECLRIVRGLVAAGYRPSSESGDSGDSDDSDDSYSTLYPSFPPSFPPCVACHQSVVDIAVTKGFISVVEHFISMSVPLPDGVLFLALKNQMSMVPLLIQNRANVAAKRENRDTVLHVAIRTLADPQLLEITQALVDAGCPASSPNSDGQFPIDIAVARGFISVVEYLLSKQVPLPRGVLFTAVRHQVWMLPFLIKNGADLGAGDGDTVLHVTMQTLEEAQCLETTQVLIGAGCHGSTPNHYGKFPIEFAVTRGFISVVEYLLSKRVPLPRTVLFTALQRQASMIPFLVHNGADIDVKTYRGETILHVTMWGTLPEAQCLEITKVLVGAGCSASIPNYYGQSATDVVEIRGFSSVMKFLESSSAIDRGSRPVADPGPLAGPVRTTPLVHLKILLRAFIMRFQSNYGK